MIANSAVAWTARAASLVLVAVALTGCVFFTSSRDRAIRRTPSFRDGYSDGCAAATVQGSNYREGPTRDDALYNSDAAYRAGWANGYQTCRPVQRGVGTTPDSNPVGEPMGH